MTATATTNLVRLSLGSVSVGLDMGRVLGIERAERMKPMPDRPELAGHVVNRAGDWPVLDLAVRLGLERASAPGHGQIVLTAIAGERFGLLVDRAAPVARPDQSAIRAVPLSVARRDSYYDGVLMVEGRPLLLLDPDRLAGEVDLFAADEAEPAPRTGNSKRTRVDRLLIMGQYEYPLPGGRVVGFGLPVACVAEMIDAPPGSPVPGSSGHVRELSSWRGRALPVIDLAAWCGLRVPAAANRRTVVVRTPNGEPIGLSAGHGIRMVPLPLPSVPARRPITLNRDRVLGVFDTNEQTLVIPDLMKLSAGR